MSDCRNRVRSNIAQQLGVRASFPVFAYEDERFVCYDTIAAFVAWPLNLSTQINSIVVEKLHSDPTWEGVSPIDIVAVQKG